MKLLIVGLGYGKKWISRARQTEHWEIGGIVALRDTTLMQVGKEFNIPEELRFKSISDALQHIEDIDAIVIATPNDSHLKLALEVLRAGKHLILEKPIVNNISQARELFREIALHKDLKIMVGQTFRGSLVLNAVRDTIIKGTIGDIEMVQIKVRDYRVGNPMGQWRFALEDVMLDDFGIHQFDNLRMLLREQKCRTIFAQIYNPKWFDLPTRTTCSALLEMENGVKVNYFSSLAVTGEFTPLVGELDISGSEGSIFYRNDKNVFAVLENKPQSKISIKFDENQKLWYQSFLLEDFYQAIKLNQTPLANIQNNLYSWLIIEAAKLSAREKRLINIENDIEEDWMNGNQA